jgi:hypothetical protein
MDYFKINGVEYQHATWKVFLTPSIDDSNKALIFITINDAPDGFGDLLTDPTQELKIDAQQDIRTGQILSLKGALTISKREARRYVNPEEVLPKHSKSFNLSGSVLVHEYKLILKTPGLGW